MGTQKLENHCLPRYWCRSVGRSVHKPYMPTLCSALVSGQDVEREIRGFADQGTEGNSPPPQIHEFLFPPDILPRIFSFSRGCSVLYNAFQKPGSARAFLRGAVLGPLTFRRCSLVSKLSHLSLISLEHPEAGAVNVPIVQTRVQRLSGIW